MPSSSSRMQGVTTPATLPLSFERLVTTIGEAHAELAAQAARAVNASLTLRNWLIGFHIEEYERRGVDRQQYGEKLLDRLAESLIQKGVSRCDRRELYRYRQFYLRYPQIVDALPPQFASQLGGAAHDGGGDQRFAITNCDRKHELRRTAQYVLANGARRRDAVHCASQRT